MSGKIYKLIHKVSDTTLYVGKTMRELDKRLKQHKNTPCGLMKHYIFCNGSDNLDIVWLEDVDEHTIDERESYWIKTLDPPYNTSKTSKAKRTYGSKMG